MKKTVIGLVAMASLMCAGQASAITLEDTILAYDEGPVSFKFSGFTLTTPAGTTAGAFVVTDFYKSTTAGATSELAAWSPAAGNYVYAVLTGFDDVDNPPAGTEGTILSTGGQFSLYETTVSFDTSSGPGVINDINLDVNKTLLLTGEFVPNTDGYTLVQTVTGTPDFFAGSGNAYAALTGGTLMDRLDSNGQQFGSDLWFSFNYSHTPTNAVNWGPAGVFITDPAVGAAVPNPIPEPATMLLFGTGLIGLAGVSRKLRK